LVARGIEGDDLRNERGDRPFDGAESEIDLFAYDK
jgi:hypothetical protein